MSQTPIAYEYDGSFSGFLCCVYDAFYRHESPSIFCGERQAFLYETRKVRTDARGDKVLASSGKKIGQDMVDFLRLCLLTCLADKEEQMLRLVRLGYRVGPGVLQMLAHPTVNALQKAVFALTHEAHLLTGFLRFTEAGGALYAVVHPKTACSRYWSRISARAFPANPFSFTTPPSARLWCTSPAAPGFSPGGFFRFQLPGSRSRSIESSGSFSTRPSKSPAGATSAREEL